MRFQATLRAASIAWLLVAPLCVLPALAQGAGESSATTVATADDAGEVAVPTRRLLDSIRDDLVQLRFEKALAAIAALLADPGMTPAERAEALVLRSQTHVAFGDMDAAEQDYREILMMRATFVPEASLTPAKAMVRFKKVQAELIGRLRLSIDPPDARLTLDDREVLADADGGLFVRAGSYRLRVEHPGYDPAEQMLEVDPGQELAVRLDLFPNARSVILSTDVDDVEVSLDGVPVGRTRRPDGASSRAPAEIILENLSLTEHVFQLRKPCYRNERLEDILTVDLLDKAPKRYDLVRLIPARSTLRLHGGPDGADVMLDGRPVGRMPIDAVEVCPGARTIQVTLKKRVVWKSVVELPESSEVPVEVTARPNLALVGADEWPRPLQPFAQQFNTTTGIAPPPSADLAQAASWSEVRFPEQTDLAVAVVAATREGARDRWYLYSPILRKVQKLDVAPAAQQRPTWQGVVWGLFTVDSEVGGPGLVARVIEGGAAAAVDIVPGDRIVAVGGTPVESSAGLRRRLVAAESEGSVSIEWRSATGDTKQAILEGSHTPRLESVPLSIERAAVRAAWAAVDSACAPGSASAALSNLALLFSNYGHHDLAAETWRQVRWGERSGIGDGTAQYYLGRELELLGNESEAIEAYRAAAASVASAFTDEGPAVGPAAADRLADLGVATVR